MAGDCQEHSTGDVLDKPAAIGMRHHNVRDAAQMMLHSRSNQLFSSKQSATSSEQHEVVKLANFAINSRGASSAQTWLSLGSHGGHGPTLLCACKV